MAYKNERDRICYQQNSCEPERHHGEMLGLSGIVLPPDRTNSGSALAAAAAARGC